MFDSDAISYNIIGVLLDDFDAISFNDIIEMLGF
jgi:hypothetical protein